MANKKTADMKTVDDIGLAKARYEYCLRLYEREQARRDTLERKAQFHLSLVTVFLGALLLRLDILTEIKAILDAHASQLAVVSLVYMSALGFVLAVLVSLLGILQTIKTRTYNPEYPANPSLKLFTPQDDYLTEYTETGFFRSVAMSYVLSLESDCHVNNIKSCWLAVASYGLLAAVLSFAALFGAISYLQLK